MNRQRLSLRGSNSRDICFHDLILRSSTAIMYSEIFFVRPRTTIRVVTRQSVTGCEGKNKNKIVPSRRAITWDASPQICPLLNPSRRIALIALLIAIFTRVCRPGARDPSHVFVSM